MQPPANSAPTTSATHGAPWWIKQAIATSASVTNDMEEADVIFVYDLCYYQRWLGQVRSGAGHGLCFGWRFVRRLFHIAAHAAGSQSLTVSPLSASRPYQCKGSNISTQQLTPVCRDLSLLQDSYMPVRTRRGSTIVLMLELLRAGAYAWLCTDRSGI